MLTLIVPPLNHKVNQKITTPTVSRDGIEIKPETDPEIQSRLANAKDELERTGILSGASDTTINTVRRLSKLLKTDIRFEVVPDIVAKDRKVYKQNGRYDHDAGTIYINMGSGTNTYTQIIAHEFTHSVEGTKLYTLLEKYARKFHDGKAGEGAFYSEAKEILEQYKAAGKDYDIRKAQAEVVSDYVADHLLNNEESIARLVKENRTLAEKLKDIVDKVLSVIGKDDTKAEVQTRAKLTRMSKLLNDALETRNVFPRLRGDIKSRLSELRRNFNEGDISESEYNQMLDELDNEALSMGLDLQELMKGGESEGGISYSLTREELLSLDINWDDDNFSTLKEQLKEHLEEVNSMEPVTEVKYAENNKTPYYVLLDEQLKKWGYKIDTQLYGSIIFDKNAINSLGNYIENDSEKAAALASPYVIKRGKVISGHKNHKNNGSTSLTFAAPVIINGQRGNVVVSIIYGKGRVHSLRVLTPNGKEFVLIKKENTEPITTKNGFPAGRRETTTKAPHISSVSIDSLSQPNEKVNSKNDTDSYSITPKAPSSSTENAGEVQKDSNGNPLTDGQVNFFKDSVVRDENGNLKVMYHGTSRGGFTWFDTFGSNHGLFGIGSYFTEDKSIAETYTKKGRGNNPQVYKAYLNIKKPMDMDGQADVTAWEEAVPDADFTDCKTNEDCYRAMELYLEDEMYTKWEGAEFAMETIMGMGYDGITHVGGGRVDPDGVRHRVYIAFYPEQIKKTDNANPTLDGDIRYSITPEKTAEESIAKSTANVSVISRLPIQSLGKLRAVEKGLRKVIGDIYKIKYARVDELKPAVRMLIELTKIPAKQNHELTKIGRDRVPAYNYPRISIDIYINFTRSDSMIFGLPYRTQRRFYPYFPYVLKKQCCLNVAYETILT